MTHPLPIASTRLAQRSSALGLYAAFDMRTAFRYALALLFSRAARPSKHLPADTPRRPRVAVTAKV
ncbi:MAG: hypothetical protein AAGJ32_06125 [Pseudomonadota bacterium]